jgi:hypothetical protein
VLYDSGILAGEEALEFNPDRLDPKTGGTFFATTSTGLVKSAIYRDRAQECLDDSHDPVSYGAVAQQGNSLSRTFDHVAAENNILSFHTAISDEGTLAKKISHIKCKRPRSRLMGFVRARTCSSRTASRSYLGLGQ